MKKIIAIAVLVASFMALPFFAGIPGKAAEERIEKLIETAATPEDHMKIADYYEKEAAKMDEWARAHAVMADLYKKRSKPLPGLAKHCSNLAKKYSEAADDFRAMAEEHREMALRMESN